MNPGVPVFSEGQVTNGLGGEGVKTLYDTGILHYVPNPGSSYTECPCTRKASCCLLLSELHFLV